MSILQNWKNLLPIPDATYVRPTASESHFPEVTGINLERAALCLPSDFEGTLNLLLFAFHQWQQPLIDRWLPVATALEEEYPKVRYYEVPTLDSYSAPQRLWINEGMRAGIPDPIARARTVSLYLRDKVTFMRTLGLGSDLTIYALLVTRSGEIVWRASGDIDEERGADLRHCVERFFQERLYIEEEAA